MSLTMLQQLQEKQAFEELIKKNQSGKERLEALSGLSAKTNSFLNVKEELQGTIKAAKSILDPKYSEQEFAELLSHHGLTITNDLKTLYSDFMGSIDPIKKRMFNQFLEILLLKKHNTLVKQYERKEKPTVMFHEEKQLELIIKDELNKIRNQTI